VRYKLISDNTPRRRGLERLLFRWKHTTVDETVRQCKNEFGVEFSKRFIKSLKGFSYELFTHVDFVLFAKRSRDPIHFIYSLPSLYPDKTQELRIFGKIDRKFGVFRLLGKPDNQDESDLYTVKKERNSALYLFNLIRRQHKK